MQGNPDDPVAAEPPEKESPPAPPKEDPKNAAGTLNPKQRNAFYEAVVDKGGKRKRR